MGRYRKTLIAQFSEAVFLLARYAEAKPASGVGQVKAEHHAEIFAYVPSTRRFVRLTHTRGAVMAFFHDDATANLVYVAARDVVLTKPEPDQKQKGVLRQASVSAFHLSSGKPHAKPVLFRNARSLEVFFARVNKRRRLVAKARSAPGRGKNKRRSLAYYILDLNEGTRTGVKWAKPRGRRLYVSHGETVASGSDVTGVSADWGDEGVAAVFRLDASRKTITMPRGLLALRSSMRWSGDKSRLAFASRPLNECSKKRGDRVSSVFVVEAATGKVSRLARTDAEASPYWAGNQIVLFAAGAGNVAIVDVVSAKVIGKLKTRVRATTWLASAPHCEQRP